MKRQLPNYPVIVIHMEDPPGSGLAACCGLPWKGASSYHKGDTLWACTGCFNFNKPVKRDFQADANLAALDRALCDHEFTMLSSPPTCAKCGAKAPESYPTNRHPYTCGICSWGRDGDYHDESEYDIHMYREHPIEFWKAR